MWCLGRVDPVANFCLTNQFLYRTVQFSTAEKPLNSRYEEITMMTDTSHTLNFELYLYTVKNNLSGATNSKKCLKNPYPILIYRPDVHECPVFKNFDTEGV